MKKIITTLWLVYVLLVGGYIRTESGFISLFQGELRESTDDELLGMETLVSLTNKPVVDAREGKLKSFLLPVKGGK